jgi:hypothetical protein
MGMELTVWIKRMKLLDRLEVLLSSKAKPPSRSESSGGRLGGEGGAYIVFIKDKRFDLAKLSAHRERLIASLGRFHLKPLAAVGPFEVLEGPQIEDSVNIESHLKPSKDGEVKT